jgi:hypothetical protein
MKNQIKVLFLLSCLLQTAAAGEIAVFGEPMKNSYKLDGLGYTEFFQTGKFVDSFSMVCDMGQAIPDPRRHKWFDNKPIPGLKLELRARAAIIDTNNLVKPMGFVVVTKSEEVLVTFKPLGEYENGKWDGDVLNSWSGVDTNIEVFSELFGKSGYAHFDLLDGNGFFYKSDNRKSPDYFLSNCKRIKKEDIPVYDWR